MRVVMGVVLSSLVMVSLAWADPVVQLSPGAEVGNTEINNSSRATAYATAFNASKASLGDVWNDATVDTADTVTVQHTYRDRAQAPGLVSVTPVGGWSAGVSFPGGAATVGNESKSSQLKKHAEIAAMMPDEEQVNEELLWTVGEHRRVLRERSVLARVCRLLFGDRRGQWLGGPDAAP